MIVDHTLKLTRLFSDKSQEEIAKALLNPIYGSQYIEFDDQAYHIKRLPSSAVIFGYPSFNFWNEKVNLEPIAFIHPSKEILLLPEYVKSYNKEIHNSHSLVQKFSGVDELLITLFSIGIYNEIKMKMKHFKNHSIVDFNTGTGISFSVSNLFDSSLNFHINNRTEYVGGYNFKMTEIEFDEKYREKGEKLKRSNLLGAMNII